MNSSLYLREKVEQKIENMGVVQAGPFIQQDCVDVLEEAMRGHKHHDEFPVNLLRVEDVDPQLGKQLEMKGNTIQAYHGRQVNQRL